MMCSLQYSYGGGSQSSLLASLSTDNLLSASILASVDGLYKEIREQSMCKQV